MDVWKQPGGGDATEVSERVGFFDRFAGWASHVASRATFFAFCVC